MKGTKAISIVLSICFSVFLGHNLIPHHHHAEVISAPVSASCPIEHHACAEDSEHSDQKHDADEHPVHCHAFNDVVFDKFGAPSVQPHVLKINTLFADICRTHLETIDSRIPSFYLEIKIPDKSIGYFGARSLRAPPAFM
jgi:hypothetical protein